MGTADTNTWTEPQGLTVLGAHPGYWMLLALTLAVAMPGWLS